MKKLMLICLVCVFLISCGGPSKFETKIEGKDYSFEIKDAVVTNGKLFATDKDGNQSSQAEHYISLANYPFNGSVARSLDKPEQIKVVVRIVSEIGTDIKSTVKPGTYSGGKIAPMTLADFSVHSFENGQQKSVYSSKFPAVQHQGEVKITAVEGETIKGEINITAGGNWTVKGPFTAKFLPSK